MKKISEKLQVLGLLIVGIIISSVIATKAATTLSSTSVYYDTSKSGGTSSNVNGAIDELYSLTNDRDKLKAEILNLTYPVGSIYMSTEDDTIEKVQERFGGTWESYSEGRTLVGVGNNGTSTYLVNQKGGSEIHNHNGYVGNTSLTTDQIPSHTHDNTAKSSTIEGSFGCAVPNNHSKYSSGSFSSSIVLSNSSDAINTEFLTGPIWGYVLKATPTITITNASTGGDKSHNHTITSDSNISPYTAVYMYKRAS